MISCGATRLGAQTRPLDAYVNMLAIFDGVPRSGYPTAGQSPFQFALRGPFATVPPAAFQRAAALCGRDGNGYLLPFIDLLVL